LNCYFCTNENMLKKNIFSSLIAMVILFLSFAAPKTFSVFHIPDIPHLDKFVHTTMYFSLTFALILENRRLLVNIKNYIFLASIPFIFGTAIEFLQSLFTTSRSGDFFDVCFNIFGILLAIFTWLLYKCVFNPQSK
jgi:VanZ family protein